MIAYNQFPVFTANQVLRHDHLNDLLNYLDEQGRLTRTQLGGIGVVCGYQFELGQAADGNGTQRRALLLSGGVGITSRGYLANADAQVFTGAVPYTIDQEFSRLENDLRLDSARSRRLGLYQELTEVYDFFLEDPDDNDSDLMDLYELIHDIATDDQAEPLSTEFLSDKVLIAYIKQDLQALKNCDVNDCNDRGARLESQVRFLLVSRNDAERIRTRELDHQDVHRPIHDDLHPRYQAPSLDNVVLQKLVVGDRMSSMDKLSQQYKSSSKECLLTLKNAIKRSLSVYQYILNPIYPANIGQRFEENINKCLDILDVHSVNAKHKLQDYYDFTATLLDAYREFIEKAWEYDHLCQAHPQLFPKHLMLGELKNIHLNPDDQYLERSPAITTGLGFLPIAANQQHFRHSFIPGNILDQQYDLQQELWALHYRLLVMIEVFLQHKSKNGDLSKVKITPSQSKLHPVSQRAIPAYLPISANGSKSPLLQLWNYRKTTQNRLPLVYSYHRIGQGAHPLRFRQENTDFYRIEGHLGVDLERVSTDIFTQRQRLGLDFGVEVVRIGDTPIEGGYRSRLSDFSRLHPGLEHQGGVPKGGTLILVYLEQKGQDQVVADFALPYNCCTNNSQSWVLQQCVYKWISSSKYLMNLTRPKWGVSILNRFYTLRVSRYEIDGIPLFGRNGRTIRIPIRDIKYYGMEAIINALNTTFPTGLIFDTAEGKDRIAIKKYAGQTFTLVIQDTSNGDKYQFDDKGRTIINNKKGNYYKAAECSMLAPNYDPNDYRRLHFSLPKNDDYQFRPLKNTDWMGWNTVVKDRAILSMDDERLILVRPHLEKILARVKNISPDAKVYLAGSWLDGSWATEDDLRADAEIVMLRETLLGKSGSSDLDIVVELPDDQQGLANAIEQEVSGHFGAFKSNVTFGAVKNKRAGLDIGNV